AVGDTFKSRSIRGAVRRLVDLYKADDAGFPEILVIPVFDTVTSKVAVNFTISEIDKSAPANESGYRDEAAERLIEHGKDEEGQGRYVQAAQRYRDALSLLSASSDADPGKIRVQGLLALACIRGGDDPQAKPLVDRLEAATHQNSQELARIRAELDKTSRK